jgi:hypothetical protein
MPRVSGGGRYSDKGGSLVAFPPEVPGDGKAAKARGVDVGAGDEGPGGEVGGAALEEEAAVLEPARGGELGGEDAGLGCLDLLLGLRQQGNGRKEAPPVRPGS